MTQPSPGMNWVPALKDILGADDDVDPTRITSPAWVQLDTSYWISADIRYNTEGSHQRPWDHWMPGDPAHAGWNRITLYRKRNTDTLENFQLIRGWISFYEGGETGPARQAQMFVAMSDETTSGIMSNAFLDPQSLYDAAHLFYEVTNWLMNTGQPKVQALVGEIDQEANGFEGSAADAFMFAMEDINRTMLYLKENITEPDDWIEFINGSGDAVGTFKTAMVDAWAAFKEYRFYDPNWLIGQLVQSMEQQVDAYDRTVKFPGFVSGGTTTGGYDEVWNFAFPDQGMPGPYDLMQPAAWEQLNTDTKTQWINELNTLNAASLAATKALMDNFATTTDKLQRVIPDLYRGTFYVPPPDPTQIPPPGGGDGNFGINTGGNNGGGGGGGEGGIDTSGLGSGGGGGGGEGGIDTSGLRSGGNTGGGGSEFDPSSVGGNQFASGSNSGGDPGGIDTSGLGAGPGGIDPSGVGGGTSIGGISGGSNSGGLNPGGGGTSIGGIGGGSSGGTGAGAGGGGITIPGLGSGGSFTGGGSSGGSVGGGAGQKPPGSGLGLGSGSSSGSGGSGSGSGAGSEEGAGGGLGSGGWSGIPGLDDPSLGGGSYPGSQVPSQIDPGNLGSGNFPSAGSVVGPLGTPPPGYAGAGALNGLATSGGGLPGGGGFNAGGYGLENLPGAILPPTAGANGANGAMGGMGGMPFMPPMGGMGGMGSPGNGDNKERERTTWLAEEEEVWGTDPDCAPAVVGRDDGSEYDQSETQTRQPAPTRGPRSPYGPSRGTTRGRS
ncbi:hypothetical protein [Micromonospora sp. NPDC004704]